MSIIVTAKYAGKIDDRREQRIQAVFKRCGVRMPIGELRKADGADGEMQIDFGDVEWNEYIDGTELTIYIGDGLERANRLASELRTCGLIVAIATEQEG